ncbi:mitogen-activated protein kinase-binding protein 1 isoform X5 [Phlebotomus argentipes]|uniref:mitogen-activated protein kinase-binding protein 1 isoform X5 n=1 Tax=Phlebotomus argentipes TaxID=94469 RepID=UPI002892D921|nr:mitogen-activated protein kinase-binding protein 1 isoform X5 [Phlebotomus argentipes]
MEPRSEVKVIRAPSLKRGKNDERLSDRIKLKKVLGLTVCSNAALDVSPTSGILAYPAGCTVVLLNAKKLSQTYLLNTSRKAITAVAFSQCGRYVATGECGINPAIKVWELDPLNGNLENGATGGNVVAEFLGHKYAVSCVAFSPTGKYLVSVGSQHDMIVNVFDWKLNLKIASNKVSAKVVAVAFSEDGSYFVTVGNRHVKFWYLEGNRKYKEPIPLMGRSAILGDLRNNDFCAVACGKGEMFESTYAITRNGQLVEFNSRRLLDKWVACRTASANCLAVGTKYILVGCAEAIVRVFNAETLEYVTTLPRTHYLGVDVAQGVQLTHMMSAPGSAKYPDTIALVYDEVRSKATCVYNDHSLYVWDLRDVRRVGKSHSFLYHSACIWGVETVPFTYVKNNLAHNLPLDCFLTCSSDDTIRVWDLDGCESNEVYRKNIYSKDLMKVAYIDDELNFIKDMDNPILNNEKGSTYDGRNGVRCIKISSERNHLATGDRSGNIRIYNLTNLKLLTTIEAHDSEVLCLEYTNERIERKLLGSASRDRLIHIFDVEQGYKILQTLDDHSSSITSIKFIGCDMNFQMISCGADKAIIFRTFQGNQFQRGNHCNGKNTLYDMEVDSNSKHILTACQDRNIRVYGSQTSKHTKTFKGSHSDEGSLIKLCLDLSGIYIATSCTDKTLSVYDYYSNECMARMYGHSELVTGLKFTNDCRHLISASGDGCVFIWQVPHDMVVTMQARLSQQALRSGQQIPIPRPISQNVDIVLEQQQNNEKIDANFTPYTEDVVISGGYKLSDVGQLPMWAKRKGAEEPNPANILATSPSQGSVAPKPRGRWAQRSQYEPEMDLRNIVDSPPNSSTNNNNPTSDYNSSSSKDVYMNTYLSEDSSIDSGLENRREITFQMKVTEKNLNSLNSESNTEHDGDVEDISDGERTSSDHGVLFYPTVAPGTPSDFKVNETNVEELRKSMRRKTDKQRLQLSQSPSAPSTGTGTGTSDDEDEASTPSGDNADRSLASTLGGSIESIPQATSFLNAALDGPSNSAERGRNSLSAIHNSGDSKPVTISKSFTNTKKEELMKIIKDAKQKLENANNSHKNDRQNSKGVEVGYRRTNLRASQSISDLSQVSKSNLDTGSRLTRPMRTGVANSFLSLNSDESSIRRACSLSDLSMGKDYKPMSSKPIPSTRTSVPASRIAAKRSAGGPGGKLDVASGGMGTRSVSMGILNHASDSEPESRGGVMKPTISSQNKVNLPSNSGRGSGKGGPFGAPRRRGMQNSYSSINLTSAGQDDSSSEEATTAPPPPSGKPAVPPRPRNLSADHKRSNLKQNNLNDTEVPCKDDNSDLAQCSRLINQLMLTTNSVVQLHSRLRQTEDASGSNYMLQELENAVVMTQNMLTKITNQKNTKDSNASPFSTGQLSQHINRLENGEYVQMREKCTDMLNKVQNMNNS